MGESLDHALVALTGSNDRLTGVTSHISFNGTVGTKPRFSNTELRSLIRHFSLYRLRNEDFEFPDMLGAAYEYLLARFADSAGQRGGEFYTPRDVVRMMVRLVGPQPGETVYDPCAGSGGMLIAAKEHVEEHGGDPQKLSVSGQDKNGPSWSMASMNMVLHGIHEFDLQHGDTLTEPLHLRPDGSNRLRTFTKVLSNPPFSLNYDEALVAKADRDHGTRMRWWAPENGKKADLMFVQHMIAVLEEERGVAATVMPHGVLFRGGKERDIRKGLLERDCIEAVIGLGPNLFYGTGIPACILILRRPYRKRGKKEKNVLFINADRDYRPGRNQNELGPEHVERIVTVYRDWRVESGYSRIVSAKDLEDFEQAAAALADLVGDVNAAEAGDERLGGLDRWTEQPVYGLLREAFENSEESGGPGTPDGVDLFRAARDLTAEIAGLVSSPDFVTLTDTQIRVRRELRGRLETQLHMDWGRTGPLSEYLVELALNQHASFLRYAARREP